MAIRLLVLKDMEVIKMKKDFGVKTWLYPMPVLMIATYNEDGSPNVMNAAWGGTGVPLRVGWCGRRCHSIGWTGDEARQYALRMGLSAAFAAGGL